MSQIIRFALILSNLVQLTDNIRVWFNIYNLSHKHETCFIHSRPTRSVLELVVTVRTGDASRKVNSFEEIGRTVSFKLSVFF